MSNTDVDKVIKGVTIALAEQREYFDEQLTKSHTSRTETDSELFRDFKEEVKKDIKLLRDEIKPVIEFYGHMTWFKKSFIWALSAVVLVGGAIAALRKLW